MDGDTVGCVRQVQSSYVGVLGCLPSGESIPVTGRSFVKNRVRMSLEKLGAWKDHFLRI